MRSKRNMAVPVEHYIEEENLSLAWSRAFLALAARRDEEIVPLLVSITGFAGGVPAEDEAVRKALDACLAANEYQGSHTVANTIFPQSLWRRAKGDRNALYEEYLENLPSYVDMAPDKNRCGLYFSRLIAYGVDPKTGERLAEVQIGKLPGLGNQLEFLIQRCKKGVRKSMFQAAVFAPARDHVGGAQQGFPCMQHVTFVPDYDKKMLAVNAFYATQQLFVKAYGNYLGLTRLGAFFADQTGLTLTKVSCFAGVEKMDQRPAAGPTLDALIAAAEAAVRGAGAQADVPVEVVG
ncbi:MAG TPA: thymidylate synthase [Thermoanaerobaculia bacterium]|nr:thymidylate synthase [Thermoanaerobaculia bacterium]